MFGRRIAVGSREGGGERVFHAENKRLLLCRNLFGNQGHRPALSSLRFVLGFLFLLQIFFAKKGFLPFFVEYII